MRSTWPEDEEEEKQEDQLLNNINVFDVEKEEIEKPQMKEKEQEKKVEGKGKKQEVVIQQPLKKSKTELVVSYLLSYYSSS